MFCTVRDPRANQASKQFRAKAEAAMRWFANGRIMETITRGNLVQKQMTGMIVYSSMSQWNSNAAEVADAVSSSSSSRKGGDHDIGRASKQGSLHDTGIVGAGGNDD